MTLDTAPNMAVRKALGVTIETTKGTAAAPTTPINDTLVYGPGGLDAPPTLQPGRIFEGGERTAIAAVAGQLPPVTTVQEGVLRFRTELVSGDITATLLQGCGMMEMSGKYQFTLDRSEHKTLSFKLWESGRAKSLYGASGQWTILGATPAGRVFMQWEFRGLLAATADEAMPTLVVPEATPFKTQGHTLTFGGADLPANPGITVTSNVSVAPRPDAGASGGVTYFMASPANAPTIAIAPEATTVANHDPYGGLLSATSAALAILMTDADSNTFGIDAANAQRDEVADGERDGNLVDEVTFGCYRTSGGGDPANGTGDQLTLTI